MNSPIPQENWSLDRGGNKYLTCIMILEDSVDAIKEGTPSPHAERNNRLAWLSNAAFIVLGAAFSYFLAFVYERAYCKYFNVRIPSYGPTWEPSSPLPSRCTRFHSRYSGS